MKEERKREKAWKWKSKLGSSRIHLHPSSSSSPRDEFLVRPNFWRGNSWNEN